MTKNKIYTFFNKPTFKHILFWIVIFIYFLSISFPYIKNSNFVFQVVIFDTLLQIVITYTILEILIPRLLNKNKRILFFTSVILVAYLGYIVHKVYECYYLADAFKDIYATRPPLIFIERITDYFIFLRGLPGDITPTILLLIFNYYKREKETANLLEQKKTNELNALRNQLNPHFLFNTLNNLYALAIKKSDKTPEVIAKLSEILDYILYRCKNDFVPLKNEVTLLHNYIALEKVRYGKRVEITFTEDIENNVQIAPLLLLTFLENAFKHGVSQEISTAKIDINIKGDSKLIEFKIVNTKPNNSRRIDTQNRDSIGLQNIKKQLDLLYLNNYNLNIIDDIRIYSVVLKINSNDL